MVQALSIRVTPPVRIIDTVRDYDWVWISCFRDLQEIMGWIEAD